MVLLMDQLINIELDEQHELYILILNNNMVLAQVQNLNHHNLILKIQIYYLYLNNEAFNTLHHKIIIEIRLLCPCS